MNATVLDVFARQIKADDVRVFGGENVEFYEWPSGSRVYVGGMDRPGRVLSGALDFAYVNQAEELELADWETLSTRTTGRAGVIVPGLLFGDCNPSQASHWILERAKSGALHFMESRHEDNPSLYTSDGQLTEQGRLTMITLDALTGVRFLRLRRGQWVNAEGAIFEFNPAVHMLDALPFDLSQARRRFRAVDFGFSHPFVCGWFAEDNDGRLYLYRQIYMTGRTVKAHSADIKKYTEPIEATICDHDAEDMATLRENGIQTTAAQKAVTVGIEKVQERLKVAGDGRPRLFIIRGSLVEVDETLVRNKKPIRTEDEFGNYRWKDRSRKDEPVKEDDHGMDMLRYGVMYRDGSTTWVRKPQGAR
jgi:phage terminase large subunit